MIKGFLATSLCFCSAVDYFHCVYYLKSVVLIVALVLIDLVHWGENET